MSKEREQQIEEIAQSSLEIPSDKRQTFIDEACGDDEELKLAVNSRIERAERARNYFSQLRGRLGLNSITDPQFLPLDDKEIGKYKVMTKIGVGGMGVVYQAVDMQLGRRVALKFLLGNFTDNKQANQRFIREAQAAASLNHPNIMTVYDVIDYDGLPVMVMELIEGETLFNKLNKGKITLEETADIVGQIADGVAKAHEAGIVHRDLKPANIMITKLGRVKILDFGLAKLKGASPLTQEGTKMGTVSYMSPEQIEGVEADTRSDVWSIGVILYECLCGERPFTGKYDHSILYSIVNDSYRAVRSQRKEVSFKLEDVVDKALDKKIEKRFQDARAFKAALEKIVDQPSVGKKALPLQSSVRFLVRHKNSIIGSALLLLVVAYAGSKLMQYQSPLKTAIASSTTEVKSIAVLPFENGLEGSDAEIMVDGLTESLINRFALLESLFVIDRNSAFTYKETVLDPQVISEELGVDILLQGRINSVGNELMVSAFLIDGQRNRQIWGDLFRESSLSNLWELEENIAVKVAEVLLPDIASTDLNKLRKVKTTNSDAYEQYMRGRFFMNQLSKDGLEKAINYFELALEEDSTFALAYTGLAETYIWMAFGYAPVDPKKTYKSAVNAAEKALSIDDELAEAYTILATTNTFNKIDVKRAEELFQHALELNQNSAITHEWYANLLFLEKRFDESIEMMNRARRLDPQNIRLANYAIYPYYFARRFDEAEELQRSIVEMDTTYFMGYYNLGLTSYVKGSYEEADLLLQDALRLSGGENAPPFVWAIQASAMAKNNKEDEARSILESLKGGQGGAEICRDDIFLSWVYISLGEYDKAIECLQFYDGDTWEGTYSIEPLYDPIRDDPRFLALIPE